MFTLNFIKNGPEGSFKTCIECPHYEVIDRLGGYSVITYSDMTSASGVERHVTNQRPDGYDTCYVMNSSGKTIDAIRPA